ncbi:MAG: transcription elongation factor GreA [Candidatus Curtissbacteria bacterium]|nr:transcription elongation factor GreA [Candidatus Curtissbacteria bacterium]
MKKPIDIKLTHAGVKKLKREQEELIAKRPGVVVRLTAAREQGDLSENAGYHASKEELGKIDSRLREIHVYLKFGEVMSSASIDTVGIGSTVTVSGDGEKRDFSIVGELEASPIEGKVSNISPIGKALLGAKVGDSVKVEIPDGELTFKILSVKPS